VASYLHRFGQLTKYVMNLISKLLTSILLISFGAVSVQAQTNNIREVGIGFTGLNSFSLQYRWGNGTKFYRLTGNLGAAVSGSDGTSDSYFFQDPNNNSATNLTTRSSTPLNLSFGAAFSVLKLKLIDEKFGFMYGSSYGLSFSFVNNKSSSTGTIDYYDGTFTPITNSSTSTSKSARASFGIVLGAYYKINDSFFVYGEVIPNLYLEHRINDNSSNDLSYYTQNNSREEESDSFGLSGLSNSGAALTLVYRFTK
jgi:hypothetical protein